MRKRRPYPSRAWRSRGRVPLRHVHLVHAVRAAGVRPAQEDGLLTGVQAEPGRGGAERVEGRRVGQRHPQAVLHAVGPVPQGVAHLVVGGADLREKVVDQAPVVGVLFGPQPPLGLLGIETRQHFVPGPIGRHATNG